MDIVTPLFRGVKLYKYHTNKKIADYKSCTGEVVVKPGKIGLLNDSGEEWTISNDSGTKQSQKKNGEVALLGLGLKIDFGNGTVAKIC